MKRLFQSTRKPYNLRSHKYVYRSSTPNSKVDACVECDLPFDESEIAPELRREQPREEPNSEVPVTRPEDIGNPNRTNLDPVDISVDSSESESTSESDSPEFCFQRAHCSLDSARIGLEVQDIGDPEEHFNEKQSRKRSEKKKDEENFTESVFVTGGLQVPVNTTPGVSSNHTDYTLRADGQRVPVINSPADIYKYFPGKANYGETSPDEEISRSRSISPEIAEPRSPSDSSDKESVNSSNMEGEYIRALNELTQKLLTRDININKFHGRENDDVNSWFEKFELILESKGIRLTDSAARTQLINNLAGPAETFMFELAPEERRDFDTLKQALVRRYSTKDRTWVKRQRLVARCQGPNQLLSDYINDMHELFSGLNMAEIDKVTYFTEGLLQPLKDKVLERMPETLLQAEEVARTIDSISNRSRQNKGSDQVERLIEALNRNQQVPATIPGTSAISNSAQPQSLQAQTDTLTKKLDNLMFSQPKENKIAAYSETDKDGQPALMKRMQEMEYQITRLSRQMNARINEIIYRRQVERINQQSSRDQRPLCHYCRAVGHFPVSCPQRDLHERGPVTRNTLPPPENTERHHYQVATLTESYHDPSYPGQPTEKHPRHAQQVPSQLNSIAVAATDQRETDNGLLLAIRTGIPVGSVPHKRVAYLGAFNTFTRKKYPPRHIDRPKDQMPHAQTCSEQFAATEEFKKVPTAEQLDPPFYHPMTSTSSQSHCADEFKETKTADLLAPAPAPAEEMFVDTQYSKSAISGTLPPKTEIVDQAWKQPLL